MPCLSKYLIVASLLSTPAPQPDESTLPMWNEAPPPVAPVAQVEPTAPATKAPLSPAKIRHYRKLGIGLSVPGAFLLATGIAGIVLSIRADPDRVEFGPDYLERQRQAEMRSGLWFAVGAVGTSTGMGFTIAGAALQSRAHKARKLQMAIAPTWRCGGGGLAIGGRF